MALENAKEIIELLYQDVDGMRISLDAQSKLDSWYAGYAYGEITYRGLLRILASVKPKEGEVFYDFGSGTGKAVYLAAMLAPFRKAVGIEILKELHETAVTLLPKFKELTGGNISARDRVMFVRGDFREVDFSDADVIFMNATKFAYEFDLPFIRNLDGLKKGTRVITSSITFESDQFSLFNIGPVPFTWGEEEVFIHERK